MEDVGRILFYLFIFVFILPFVIFIFYLFFKGKKQAWKGEIIDKKITTTEDFDSGREEIHNKIIIKLESGRTKYLEVDRTRYDAWDVGDKLEKKSGELWPEKVK